MKMSKRLMKDTSDPNYELRARQVKQFEAEYGEKWDGTRIENNNDFVSLPFYVVKAAHEGSLRTVLQWLDKGNIKERVNAKSEDFGNAGLLFIAAMEQKHDLMSYLLFNGADVNLLNSIGSSVIPMTKYINDHLKAVRLLLSWGAELCQEGKRVTKEQKLRLFDSFSRNGHFATVQLLSSELGGRRCEIISAPDTRSDLIGKTCVVAEYITKSNQCKATMEFTKEVLLLGVWTT